MWAGPPDLRPFIPSADDAGAIDGALHHSTHPAPQGYALPRSVSSHTLTRPVVQTTGGPIPIHSIPRGVVSHDSQPHPAPYPHPEQAAAAVAQIRHLPRPLGHGRSAGSARMQPSIGHIPPPIAIPVLPPDAEPGNQHPIKKDLSKARAAAGLGLFLGPQSFPPSPSFATPTSGSTSGSTSKMHTPLPLPPPPRNPIIDLEPQPRTMRRNTISECQRLPTPEAVEPTEEAIHKAHDRLDALWEQEQAQLRREVDVERRQYEEKLRSTGQDPPQLRKKSKSPVAHPSHQSDSPFINQRDIPSPPHSVSPPSKTHKPSVPTYDKRERRRRGIRRTMQNQAERPIRENYLRHQTGLQAESQQRAQIGSKQQHSAGPATMQSSFGHIPPPIAIPVLSPDSKPGNQYPIGKDLPKAPAAGGLGLFLTPQPLPPNPPVVPPTSVPTSTLIHAPPPSPPMNAISSPQPRPRLTVRFNTAIEYQRLPTPEVVELTEEAIHKAHDRLDALWEQEQAQLRREVDAERRKYEEKLRSTGQDPPQLRKKSKLPVAHPSHQSDSPFINQRDTPSPPHSVSPPSKTHKPSVPTYDERERWRHGIRRTMQDQAEKQEIAGQEPVSAMQGQGQERLIRENSLRHQTRLQAEAQQRAQIEYQQQYSRQPLPSTRDAPYPAPPRTQLPVAPVLSEESWRVSRSRRKAQRESSDGISDISSHGDLDAASSRGTGSSETTEEKTEVIDTHAETELDALVISISSVAFSINGHFGDVFEGTHRTIGRIALKRPRISATGCDDSVIKRFEREAATWQRLRHTHILEFIGTLRRDGHIYIVSPFIDNGTLMEYVIRKPKVNKVRLLCETADAVNYLHIEGVVHGDIKGGNILIGKNGSALLCDFGLTRTTDARTSTSMKGAGSSRWMSPDLWDNAPRSSKSDVYAFGMTIVEVLSGTLPFPHLLNPMAIMRAVITGGERPIKEPLSSLNGSSYETAWQVAEACWQTSPSDRICMSEAFQRLSQDPSIGRKP